MAAILHSLHIKVPAGKAFAGISLPAGLDQWWTKESSGKPGMGEKYILDFGPGYIWKARVTKYIPAEEFELQMTVADAEWMNTSIGFILSGNTEKTKLDFYHTGWAEETENYRGSSYCWAMYLRILKRHLEYGEEVPYSKRLSV